MTGREGQGGRKRGDRVNEGGQRKRGRKERKLGKGMGRAGKEEEKERE